MKDSIISNEQVKRVKEAMKNIRKMLKEIEENETMMDLAITEYTFNNARRRVKHAVMDIMDELNEMAEESAIIYNHCTFIEEQYMAASVSCDYERQTF